LKLLFVPRNKQSRIKISPSGERMLVQDLDLITNQECFSQMNIIPPRSSLSLQRFLSSSHSQIVPLWSCKCHICDAWKRDIKALSRHITTDHENKFIMCGLCIDNKKVFPSEQKIYTKGEYDNHLKNGGEGGFEGHPKCEFCKRRYYDKDALFVHLQKDHFTCHLCDKAGIRYRYYNDYDSLEEHFRKEHILCEERECLMKKFVVFADPIDHAAHMMQIHPNVQVRYPILHFLPSISFIIIISPSLCR
jgi:hypothetical protein